MHGVFVRRLAMACGLFAMRLKILCGLLVMRLMVPSFRIMRTAMGGVFSAVTLSSPLSLTTSCPFCVAI
jgi:hypothetical protein